MSELRSWTYALLVQCAGRNDEIRAIIGRAADEIYAHEPTMVKVELVVGSDRGFAEPVLRFATPDDLIEEDDS